MIYYLGIIVFCIISNEHLHSSSPVAYGANQDAFSNKNYKQIIRGPDQRWTPTKDTAEKVKADISKLNITYHLQNDWPQKDLHLGAVTAVSLDSRGDVVIFHRVDRVWTQDTFDMRNVFQQRNLGAIPENTILTLGRETGDLVHEWGKNLFYMPHGLTVDQEDNVWVTDVAMHQVFKFAPRGGDGKPLLTLGTQFTPGSGATKFCKPTSVAVLDNGDFFVADGYCNARIVKYSKEGEKILSWGQNSFSGVAFEVAPKNYLTIPHALTLVPEKELICTADRENGRVQCFFWANGTFHSQYHNRIVGDRLFSVAYTPADGGELLVVNGPTAELGYLPEHYNEVRGFVLNMDSEEVVSKFGPNGMQFENPHDVAVTVDGAEVFVADLNNKIYKFTKSNGTTSSVRVAEGEHLKKPQTTREDPNVDISHVPGSTAIIVVALMLLFALMTFALALYIARRRRKGNAMSAVGQPSSLVYRQLAESTYNDLE